MVICRKTQCTQQRLLCPPSAGGCFTVLHHSLWRFFLMKLLSKTIRTVANSCLLNVSFLRRCRFEGKNLGSTIPDPPPHSQYDETRCEETMPCLKRYRMTGLAIPIVHHGSLCGSLQEELRNFRWIPPPTEARFCWLHCNLCFNFKPSARHENTTAQIISLNSGFCNWDAVNWKQSNELSTHHLFTPLVLL